ncbi:helix-turn-helix transcriptional regulator [Hyphomicrobium sp. CS1BSMeth3]|uniref:helix-turn-helix transcriptional regulator n=1 Tax=Hyphomicrobium sp. CS1BSMeth3 TaxID=1892844 RepID=UPI000930F870|nr:helix-turn-helix transcriptional regulator [Hyphomicrobium sp. CS1BSMeth3]
MRLGSDWSDRLIDRIYEAGVVPEQWPAVLDDLTKLADGAGALILSRSRFQEHFIGTPEAVRIFAGAVAEGWQGERNPRAPRLFGAKHAGFLTDLDVFTREEIEREPYFTEFLRPLGLGWGAATAIEVPSGDVIAFDVERSFERGPIERPVVERLDELRPHLARASMLSARLAFERSRAAALALEHVGLPAAVLGRKMHILAANPSLEAMMPGVVQDRSARVALVDHNADALLAEALSRLALSDDLRGVRSIPIPARQEQPPLIVHLVPIRLGANDVFSSASAILVLTPVVPAEVPTADVLQGLFDLTAAEARVARSIAQTQTIESIADNLGVSRETVRSQLKAVLAKTGTARQVDLAALLAGSRIPPH